MITAKCCLCGRSGVRTTGKEIYPHRRDLHDKRFFKCPTCPDVYVGCHVETGEPFGIMADRRLRALKMQAHSIFDPLWREKKIKRFEGYSRLAKEMEIPTKECHFGYFNEHQLIMAISYIKGWKV